VTSSCEVVVIGAGPAGLMAAWRAAAGGHDVMVLERADGPGGMAASFDVAGLRVDHGSHRLHPSCPPPILAALRSLLGDDLQTRPRRGRIRLAERWVGFPLRAGDLARNLPPRFAAAAALDAATSPLRRLGRSRPATFAEVVRAGLGATVSRELYEPYAVKLWGLDAAELDGDLARRRVGTSSPWAVARRLASGSRPTGRTFLYPRRGFGQISEALADAATAAGVRLRFATAVESLDLGSRGGVTVALGDGTTVDAARVWSTAPLPALARVTTPAPPPTVLAAADRLTFRAMVLVYLVLDRPSYTAFDAHYLPTTGLRTSRVSEPRNYRSSVDDPADRTVLCAELPATIGDDVWSADADQLASMVGEELAAVGLPSPAPVAVEVRRLPRVYPVYRHGYQWALSALELWASSHPQLLTFGRHGLFVPDNTHHVLAMGRAAAEALGSDGSFDDATWDAARADFRSFVVED